MPRKKCFCLVLTVSLLVPAAALAQPAPATQPSFDERVSKAIEAGVQHLWSQQKGDGSWGPEGAAGGKGHFWPDGPSALACLALLESGVKPQDEKMAKALKFIEKIDSDMTYSLGIRCNVWLAASKENKDFLPLLYKDANKLIQCTTTGAYCYDAKATPSFDHSNSQYGVYGVWAASRASPPLEVSNDYWWLVMKHWLESQGGDGGWSYQKLGESRGTMTCAGINSLIVCFDFIFADAFIKCDLGDKFKPIQNGLDWMDKNFDHAHITGSFGYFWYGVERVGLASGYKYFGAQRLVQGSAQRRSSASRAGNWGGRHGARHRTVLLLFPHPRAAPGGRSTRSSSTATGTTARARLRR